MKIKSKCIVCGASIQVPVESFVEDLTEKQRDKLKEVLNR